MPAEPATAVPDVARRVFGAHVDLAVAYVDLLATDGIAHGLIGPREGDRLWERHVLNCAAVAEVIPHGARVVDVGSGAGLPGIALAIARPDLDVVLLEPLERRVAFLEACRDRLPSLRLQVVRGRAEEKAIRRQWSGADVVTARALAPLDRLAGWCLPLVRPGGHVLAVKGERADDEVRRYRQILIRYGARRVDVRRCGTVDGAAATVVDIVRGERQKGERP